MHERYLPLLALMAGGALWSDGTVPHQSIPRSWPVRAGMLVAAKTAAAAAQAAPGVSC